MLRGIAREQSLRHQHLQEPSQTPLERDFAGLAIFMGLRAAEFGQQLHFDPFEGNPQVEEKARRDPA